ncbi:hypothetical protein PHET_02072 [Paragonimus heterotremus]|uniref:Uncharacterized protein n=1 Tax=Paragonimus heterotremus TaxID=100268 RepID=A0A8J4TDC8_9TREM|nr:hypothetical protein PHET_02072 [Paragonimus heterotremus]
MVPHVEWVDGSLMVNWSQKMNRSQRLTYVHLLIVHDDNIYKQTALEELSWHVFPVTDNRNTDNKNNNNVNKFQETKVFFAVENAAGISPFIHATIQTDSMVDRFATVRFYVSNAAGSSAQIIELHSNPTSQLPTDTEEEPREPGCKIKFILIQQTDNNKWYHHLPGQIFSTGNLAPHTVYMYQLQIEVVDSGLIILTERSAVVELRTFAGR